jgi:YidC/Oxa1 family membrane protein insertase
MLFLPAALGVYMLTNSLLGITQQVVTQRLFPNIGSSGGGKDIVVTAEKKSDKKQNKNESSATAAALRKGKARV